MDSLEIDKIRSWFPILNHYVYLNSAAKGALSKQVKTALQDYITTWDERGSPWITWMSKVDQAKRTFANLISAEPEEVATTFCTSTGLNAIVSSLDFSKRKKIIVSDNEFPTIPQILLAQERRGAKVTFISSSNIKSNTDLLDHFDQVIDYDTAFVVAQQVNYVTGEGYNIRELARICHSKGAYLFTDVYHSAGVVDINAKDLDADFILTGTMNALLGSAGGVAFLYVKKDVINQLEPLFTGWFGQSSPFSDSQNLLDFSPSASRFETGLPPIASIYAAVAGLELISELQVARIEPYVINLTKMFIKEVTYEGFKIISPKPGNWQGPMIAVKSKDGSAAVSRLKELGIMVAGSWEGSVRFSFHFYNTQEDVSKAIEAIKKCKNLFEI